MFTSLVKHRGTLLSVVLVMILAILACNAPGVGDTDVTLTPDTTPTPVVAAEEPEEEETPEPTEEEEEEETPEPTEEEEDGGGSTTGGGSSSGGSSYSMVFVQDVNVPDGTDFAPGAKFDKTWRVRNNGSTTWPQGTQLVFLRGNQMGGPASVTVPSTAPGDVIDVTVSLTAPGSDGEYTGYWRLRAPNGQQFGTEVFVDIDVKGGGSDDGGGDDGGGGGDGSDLVILEIKVLEEPEAGNEFKVRVTVKNEGNQKAGKSKLKLDVESEDDPEYDIPELDPGKTHAIEHSLEFDNDGDYEFKAFADNSNDVSEANEGNNAAIITIEVGSAVAVYKDGSFTLDANECADFDKGDDETCGGNSDVKWYVDDPDLDNEDQNRELRTEGDAEFKVMGSSKPSYGTCSTTSLNSESIDGDEDDTDIPDGTYICFETDDDRFGYMYIEDYGEDLKIQFVTWEKDGD